MKDKTLEQRTYAILNEIASHLVQNHPLHPGALITENDDEPASQTVSRLAEEWGYRLDAPQRQRHTEFLLGQCRTMLGRLNPGCAGGLRAVIEDPSEKNWDESYLIIIGSGRIRTLWQAVIAVDPTFPKTGPAEDSNGKRLAGWSRVPSADLIVKAILHATTENSAARQ